MRLWLNISKEDDIFFLVVPSWDKDILNKQIYIGLSGYVWEDVANPNKQTTRNDLYDEGETLVQGVTVRLKNALRETDGLKYAIKEFNKNAKTLERLAQAIEKQNELKERELALLEREAGITRALKPRNY